VCSAYKYSLLAPLSSFLSSPTSYFTEPKDFKDPNYVFVPLPPFPELRAINLMCGVLLLSPKTQSQTHHYSALPPSLGPSKKFCSKSMWLVFSSKKNIQDTSVMTVPPGFRDWFTEHGVA
jgi:hypothetical protein